MAIVSGTTAATISGSKALQKPRLPWRYRHRQAIVAWIILIPILLYYAIFSILPVVLNLIVSFTDWNGLSDTVQWVGLQNYARYLRDPYPFLILNTAFFALVILVIQTTVAFFVAVLLNQKLFGRGLYRALWYIPTLTSAAIMAQIALAFINPYGGVLNGLLKSVGTAPVIWTVDAGWMRMFVILFSIWRGLGSPIVLFLAALQGISRELYEAAQVDGASPWRLLVHITIPLLKPMILFVVITSIIGGFQIFEAVYIMTKGGPFNQTNVLLVQLYNDAFINSNLGVASAGAMIMMVLLLWFSIVNIRMLQRG